MKLTYQEWLKTEKKFPQEIKYLREVTDKSLLDMYTKERGFSLDVIKAHLNYYKWVYKHI